MNLRFVMLCVSVVAAAAISPDPVLGNPLYEHRQAVRSGAQASSVVDTTVRQVSDPCLVEINVPSARLLALDARSGDPVVVVHAGGSFTAYLAFADELARSSASADSHEELPPPPGMTVVVDRDVPSRFVVIDATHGGGLTRDSVSRGVRMSLRLPARNKNTGN